jgi:hypothetical protein
MAKAQFISSKEYSSRLSQLAWKVIQNGSHYTAYAPDGIGMVTWSDNNWNKNWHQVARDLTKFAKGGRGAGGYQGLDFVWRNPFIVPANFNKTTQDVKNDPIKIKIQKIISNIFTLTGKELSIDNGLTWNLVIDVDYEQNGQGIDVMFNNGNITTIAISQQILIKQ